MDENDATFESRVEAIIHKTNSAAGPSTFSDAGQSGASRTYASCFTAGPYSGPGAPPPIQTPSSNPKEDIYWRCRRSLRLWPVQGSDMKEGLKDFLKHRLRLSPVFLSDMGEIGAKRVASTSSKVLMR